MAASGASGPVSSKQRRCNDVVFLLLFLIFWAGMGFVGWQAIQIGDPRLLIFPLDSFSNHCGMTNSASGVDLSSKPYLYFVNPFDSHAAQVCVSRCPDQQVLPASINASNTICTYSVDPSASSATLANAIESAQCAGFIYKSHSIFYRCFPTDPEQFVRDLQSTNATGSTLYSSASMVVLQGQTLTQQLVSDFYTVWWWFLVFGGFAMVLGFLWIVLLRYTTGLFVWLVIFVSAFCINGFAVFMYFAWQDAQSTYNAAGGARTDAMTRNRDTFFGFFIVSIIVAVVLDLVILVMRKRVKIAIQIMKEASAAVKSMPLLLLFPILPFLMQLGLFTYWIIIEVYLASATQPPVIQGTAYPSSTAQYFQWYHFFGLLWGLEFTSGLGQTVIAGSVASWYWTFDKRTMRPHPILRSLSRTMRFNLGSICLGSLIIAVIQIVRVCIAFLERQLKGKENKYLKLMLTCLQCCFACAERFFKFVNKNAYIEIAINGGSFCTAAQNAFALLVRNAFRLVAIDAVSGFILFLSKLVVATLSACGAYQTFNYYYRDNQLNYIAAPVFIVFLESYAVIGVFALVYDVAIDTIFLSFCEDSEKNDGSSARPYFMSKNLQVLASAKSIAFGNKIAPVKDLEGDAEKIISTRQANVEDL